MNPGEYETMYEQERSYWWFVGRTELLAFYRRRFIGLDAGALALDLGCGTGINLEALSAKDIPMGIDMAPEALALCRRRGLPRLVRGRGEALPLGEGTVDLVVAMDALEHIHDDVQACREAMRVLRPGGVFLVTVPAYGFLWSEHDEALHHFRRYSAAELRNKLTVAGFEVGKVSYVLFILFFPILLFRVVQNIFKQSTSPKTSIVKLPGWANALLIAIQRVEMQALRWINFPFGVSCIALARKPAAGAAATWPPRGPSPP